jgi:hypothetical protein
MDQENMPICQENSLMLNKQALSDRSKKDTSFCISTARSSKKTDKSFYQ